MPERFVGRIKHPTDRVEVYAYQMESRAFTGAFEPPEEPERYALVINGSDGYTRAAFGEGECESDTVALAKAEAFLKSSYDTF